MRTGTTELAADGVAPARAMGAASAMVAAGVEALARVASGSESLGEWLAVVGACQGIVNRVTALQDVAVAAAARVEQVWCEDGTLGEVVHGPGRVALDAADLVAPLLGVSHHRAVSRVEEAVRLTGWDPAPVEVRDAPARSGLEGLHAAMRDGRLDGYRASVVAFELAEAPAEVADAVVAALEPWLAAEPGPGLRRRTRRLLARVSPDLLVQRAVRARAETGLRRWVSEPGVDTWYGTFPSEDSATAWAAVDALAKRYVLDGTCATIEQARGKALTDLVTQQADVTVTVHLTVPADTTGEDAAGGDTKRAGDSGHPDGRPDGASAPTGESSSASPGTAAGERSRPPDPPKGPGERPLEGCAEPGEDSSQGALPADPAAAVEPPAGAAGRGERGSGTTRRSGAEPAAGRPAVAGRGLRVPGSGGDLVAVTGSRPGEPVLVPAAWLAAHTRDLAKLVACHPGTGARVDWHEKHSTQAYRPGKRLIALVKARDGRCRFPGCSVAARFCDVDHVRPWPTGPTEASNLMCLCRRHHRIKQAPGWRVRLHPDRRASWTGPTGRVTVTEPLDALDTLVLHPDPTAEPAALARRAGEPEPGQLPSALEDAHDHRLQELEVRAAAWRERRHRRDRGDRRRGGDRDRWDRVDVRVRIDRHPWRDARGRPVTLGPWVVDGHHHRQRRAHGPENPPF